jgi:glycopeptide antibiotics resistance protein
MNRFVSSRVRNQLIYLLLICLSVVTGIASRSHFRYFPDFLAEYLGDTLWAAMVYFFICLVFNRLKTKFVALFALIFSCLIEVSQLYQAGWINAIRSTLIGALALGHGFLWSDIVCYAAGVGFAVLIDWLISEKYCFERKG